MTYERKSKQTRGWGPKQVTVFPFTLYIHCVFGNLAYCFSATTNRIL